MPELPEVETIKLGLSKLLVGHTIKDVSFDTSKSLPNALEEVRRFLIGAKVLEVKRRAKVLLIELSSKYSLVIHLKMTGQLVFIGYADEAKSKKQKAKSADDVHFGAGHPNESLIGKLPDKSTRVVFELEDQSVKGLTFHKKAWLYFNDQRKFGWMRLIPTAEVPNIDFIKKLGPEPLEADFTVKDFRERLLHRPKSNIKAVLLDQTVIAGVGNIYADESLWGAKIHPTTLVKDISTVKLNKLYEELQFVLKLSIEKGGSTDRNYVDAEGKKGSYMSFARVFRREGQPCPRCGITIIKTRVAGPGTHLCPNCQKITGVKP